MGSAGHRSGAKYYGIAIISLLLIGVVGYSYGQDFRRTRQINRELAAMQHEVITLQTRNVELEDLLKYFDSESYAESRARLELGLVRPGEKVLVVPPARATPEGVRPKTASRESAGQLAPLRAWWSFFFSRQPGESS